MSSCPICLEGQTNIQSVCGHAYHITCLFRWLNRQTFCPICRLPLVDQPIAARLRLEHGDQSQRIEALEREVSRVMELRVRHSEDTAAFLCGGLVLFLFLCGLLVACYTR